MLEEAPAVERALIALVVETGLLVVTTVLPAPPSKLLRLGDREIRNGAARWSSGLETPLGFALLTAAVAGAVDTIDGEEDWGDWATAELLEAGVEPVLGAPAGPATLAGGVEPAD
ncbi:MAG TPA: hypothetical protein VKF17_09620 [Isosphaeraceae bacterium]|nr:hypothetical protein [Isosphaeraceae bacterium]